MLPNIHTKPRIHSRREALLFLRAYSIPLFILVTTAAIVYSYNFFVLSVLGNGAPFPLFDFIASQVTPQKTHHAATITEDDSPPPAAAPLVRDTLRVFMFLFTNTLFTLMYVSFFRAVCTAPGAVDRSVWRHPPRSNTQEQQRQGHTWAQQQDWIETQRRLAAVMAAYNKGGSAGATEEVALGGLQEMEHMAATVVAAQMAQERAAQQRVTVQCDTVAPQPTTAAAAAGVTGRENSKHATVQPQSEGEQPAYENPNLVLQFEADGRYRYCTRCEHYKPDNAHHCRACGRCTLDMDHHCHFLNNCVGHNNYKYFLLLIAYAFLCGTLNNALMVYTFCLANSQWLGGHSFERRVRLSWLWLAVAMTAYAFFTGYLLAYHLMLLYNGRATLDQMTATAAENLLIQQGYPVRRGLRPCLAHVCCRRPLLLLPEADRVREEQEWRARRRARAVVVFGSDHSLLYNVLPLAPRQGPSFGIRQLPQEELV